MPITYWDPKITLYPSADIGHGGLATGNLDLADKRYDKVAVAVQVGFSAAVDDNTVVTFYDGMDGGNVIDTVGFGALTFTAATSATVLQSTLIDRGHPYLQVVAINHDSAATVNVEIVAQGHYDGEERRMV